MFEEPGRTDFSSELDTTITFKLNSELKEEFDKLCKSEHSNMSRELNAYMRRAVAKQNLSGTKSYY